MSNLEPGRELDAKVAEALGMGSQWTVQLQPDGSFLPTGEVWHECPEFSTDIAAAWQVIGFMHKQGYWCQMRTPFDSEEYHCWAGFTPHGTTGWNGKPDHWMNAETMPHAICLAFLEVIEKRANEKRYTAEEAAEILMQRYGRKKGGD